MDILKWKIFQILKTKETAKIFTILKLRYGSTITGRCNQLLKTRKKMHSLNCKKEFLQKCLLSGIVPKWLFARIKNSKLKHSIAIEGIFLRNEISSNDNLLRKLSTNYRGHLEYLQENLIFTDFIELLKFTSVLSKRLKTNLDKKNNQSLNFLKSRRFGTVKKQHINNLSSYQLTDEEKLALSFGLNFSLPVTKVNREEVITAFEMFHSQMKRHVPLSNAEEKIFKTSLGSLAHGYTTSKVDINPFVPVKNIRRSLAQLKRNDTILITKPDKGSGTVILDKEEYLEKMMTIVQDTSKFEYIGPVETSDKTHKRESELKEFLHNLVEIKEISDGTYRDLRPVGSQRPRLYGLPKTHKKDNPLRPILSMIGSPQHKLAKYLNALLQPVIAKYSTHNIQDSFEFAKKIRATSCSDTFMASFDVRSLFTNVPLLETINICADVLFENAVESFYLEVLFEEEKEPELTRESFVELMKLATSKTEFSINYYMYRQIDGVAMGSPLGPTLANIFMGYLESKYFSSNDKPLLYYRYVDDCFILFRSKDECLKMFNDFNSLHHSIEFTMELEENDCLPFLDVLVRRTTEEQFITSVYRKKTFTGQYINFLSHCSRKRKINLIKTLCHRAVMICSSSTLEDELKKITSILEENGYPSQLIAKTIDYHRAKLLEPKKVGADRCHIPIKLPFLGEASTRLKKEDRFCVFVCTKPPLDVAMSEK